MTLTSPGIMVLLPLLLVLTGCDATAGPDLGPVRDGLGLIGLGIVLAAFIRVLGSKPTFPPGERREAHEEGPQ